MAMIVWFFLILFIFLDTEPGRKVITWILTAALFAVIAVIGVATWVKEQAEDFFRRSFRW